MASVTPLHIIILAAGEGKRMRSSLPKVLQRIAGKPMLAHVIDCARELNPAAIHIVFGHGGEQVRSAFATQIDLNWVLQSEQLGTGHAVQQAMSNIPDGVTVMVLYGDVPLIRAAMLQGMLDAMDVSGKHAALTVLTAELTEPKGYGRIVQDGKNQVLAIVEEKDATLAQRQINIVNTGIIAADAKYLRIWLDRIGNSNVQREYLLTDIFALAAADGKPAVAVKIDHAADAMGANDAWQLAALERRYQQFRTRELALAGVRMADPARIEVRGKVQAGCDVELDIDVILEGDIVLGDGVRIGPFCRLRDVTLASDTEVKSHCDLEGVRTSGACVIGPFARLRPGTELAAGVHIGNFVETKKARIGKNSKANHLSYLGDAEIGAQVNIGAGTITCNYDGANKQVTTIEDAVFVGSNSALVAPVTLGKGATIGAGSVINKNAVAGELTLTRAKQVTLPGWKRPTKPK